MSTGRGPTSSRRFVVASVVLAVTGVGGVGVVASRVLGGGPTPPAATAAVPAQGPDAPQGVPLPAASADPAASSCGLAPGDQALPGRAPAATLLDLAPGLAVPVVDGAGPGVTEGITRCFAHSPTGALLAAVNWVKWFSSQQRLDEVVTTLMAPGADRDRLAADVASTWDGSTRSGLQVHGFRVGARSGDEVVVTLAVRSVGAVDDTLTALPVLLRWQDGDWKIVTPQIDSWGQETIQSLTLAGYTPWTT